MIVTLVQLELKLMKMMKLMKESFFDTLDQEVWNIIVVSEFGRIPTPSPWTGLWGVFLKVFPGSDGLVRVVNVKTSTGILKRAITKVVPLPIPVDPATVKKNNWTHFTIS
ncbi:hypothetical protein TNCV_791401 [Trichonephila clavipes]|nr:hypothetical protein TNCV_791401 [Trichonephila clavipes]